MGGNGCGRRDEIDTGGEKKAQGEEGVKGRERVVD